MALSQETKQDFEESARWVVRIGGQDIGPLSSMSIRKKLSHGDIMPDTLVLDMERFERSRLRDTPAFLQYLEEYNTQNPVLLKEQELKRREKQWERKKGKALWGGTVVLFAAIFGMLGAKWLDNERDVYLPIESKQAEMKVTPFRYLKRKKMKDWEQAAKDYRAKTHRVTKRRIQQTQTSTKPQPVIDFEGPEQMKLPQKTLMRFLQRFSKSLHPCIHSERKRNRHFSRVVFRFLVAGSSGHVTDVGFEGEAYPALLQCAKHKTKHWRFLRFGGNAVLLLPFSLSK
ncbi:MAG TPA: hypothetical protein DCE42_21185 [Myxococcales bacterium]|nr:hypothetical protein [Deltaproteobacteria bacterium]MBK07421.1 hypothetical protein [Deltaproteobacteria bacterium]MBU48856.1 hypothetical protein [Deltaproteobacteria bacterium]HAA57294.1 hypothetical protein [Myxococcales bacterium]|tara:strand:- start:578 stop:1435 length:858 start_codon:yes stop_codon:yes gene_type:complete